MLCPGRLLCMQRPPVRRLPGARWLGLEGVCSLGGAVPAHQCRRLYVLLCSLRKRASFREQHAMTAGNHISQLTDQ